MAGSHSSAAGQRLIPADQELRAREERLEALKTAIGRVAHDVNNMLAPMLGYLTLIGEEVGAEGTVQAYLGGMESASRRAEAHMETVLLAVRPNRRFSPSEMDLAALLERRVKAWKDSVPPEAGIELSVRLEPCVILGDERQWTKAADQLLANARYALALGGRLEVALSRERLAEAEREALGLSSEEVFKLVFSDNGLGMSEAAAKRAFDPFFTTRTQVKAAGLGLAIAHGVAQVHGGQITLRSVEDEGTAITIFIPKREPELAEIPGRARSETGAAAAKIMLIETDSAAREVLRGWLISEVMEVHQAGAEGEARKIISRLGPSLAGLVAGRGEANRRLLSEAVESGGGVPAMLLAGEEEAPAGMGPAEYLERPVRRERFREALQAMVKRGRA